MTKLEKMLKYVSEHNEFYKNRIKEYGIKDPLDITQWPVLTRKELQENRYNMFSDGYKSKYFNQQLRRQSSSGSSGMPVNVYWDYKDWYASNMSLWRKRLQWYGIHPNDKYVMFTLNAFNVKNDGETIYYIKEPANILSVNVSLIQNDSGYDKLVDIINEFEPKWLYIQPFVLNKLIQAYKRTEKAPPKTLKYIESVGELLASDLRRRAIAFFKVPLANMYGSEEMNGIAYECPDHCMHVLSDNVYLEINGENGIDSCGEGNAIITNLNNKAMPLIRYNQGDVVSRLHTVSNLQISLNDIKGRLFSDLPKEGGNQFNTITLLESVAEINNVFGDVVISYYFEYHLKQLHLICYAHVLPEMWFDRVSTELKKILQNKIGNEVSIDICQTSTYTSRKTILEIK